jgi:hypothetical protein
MDKYVREHLEEQETLGEHIEHIETSDGADRDDGPPAPEGLDILEEAPEGDEEAPAATGNGQELAERLTDMLLTSHGNETIELPGPNGESVEVPREAFLADVQEAMSQAAVERKADKGHANLLLQPINDVKNARRKLDSARDGLLKVEKNAQFDRDKFNQELEAARRSLEALEAAAGKEAGAKGEG